MEDAARTDRRTKKTGDTPTTLEAEFNEEVPDGGGKLDLDVKAKVKTT